MAITLTKTGYVKRLPVATYRQQKRGGIGVAGMELKDEDEVDQFFFASTHEFVLFFTSVGKVYRLKVHELPEAGRVAKGKHLSNLLPLRQDETVRAVIRTRNFDVAEGRYLIFATRGGMVKKTLFGSYNTPLKADGIIAIDVRPGDELMQVRHCSGDDDIIMVSRLGQAVRFHENAVRPMGRNTSGVIGMRLRRSDEVIAMDIARDDSDLLVITEELRTEIAHNGAIAAKLKTEDEKKGRVNLKSGGATEVTMEVPAERLRYWDEQKKQYVVEPGDYELLAGAA